MCHRSVLPKEAGGAKETPLASQTKASDQSLIDVIDSLVSQ
jgi:hypothetical protein